MFIICVYGKLLVPLFLYWTLEESLCAAYTYNVGGYINCLKFFMRDWLSFLSDSLCISPNPILCYFLCCSNLRFGCWKLFQLVLYPFGMPLQEWVFLQHFLSSQHLAYLVYALGLSFKFPVPILKSAMSLQSSAFFHFRKMLKIKTYAQSC